MALNTVSTDRLSTNVKASNLNSEFGQLGNRNLIINGTMEVSQRGTSAVVTSDGSNEGYNTVDRWQTIFAGSAGGALSTEQSSDAPDGFFKSVLLKCTTASTSLSGSEHVLFSQKLEGQNLSSLEWGKTSPKSVTFSWYMKAVNPKTLAAQLTTPVGSGRYFLKKFTPTTSWARYSFTIPGDSVATTTANAEGLALRFGLSIGSSMQQAADSTAWSSAAKHGVSGQGNFLDSTSNQLFITGVQLEVGSVATDFEHRSFAQELALCQRYFYMAASGADSSSATVSLAFAYTSTSARAVLHFPVTMRTVPDPFEVGGTDYFRVFQGSGVNDYPDTVGAANERPNVAEVVLSDGVSGLTVGQACLFRLNNAAARIGFTAEL